MSKVTFYAYHADGTLRKNKFQTEYPKVEYIAGRQRQEDRFISKYEPIIFEKGIYVTDNEDIIDFLSIYNTGGVLKNEKDILGRPFEVRPETILAIIKKEAPNDLRTITKTETVTKEVHTISRGFLHALDAKALQAYCVSYSVAMPEEKTKEALIKVLETAGLIHD